MTNYKFSAETNWFSLNQRTFEQYILPLADDINVVIEIGVWEGQSTIWMLENMDIRAMHCIDTFEGGDDHKNHPIFKELISGMEETFRHNIRIFTKGIPEHKNPITIYKGKSEDIMYDLMENINSWADLVYIDGSHKAKDVMMDLIHAYKVLRIGGHIVCDDYNWGTGDTYYQNLPKYAIDTFKTMFSNEIVVVLSSNVFIMRKVK